MDELEKLEDKYIDLNNKIEIKVIDEILDNTCKYLGVSLRSVLLNKESLQYKDIIINILNKYNYNRNDFYFDVLVDIATHDDLDIDHLCEGLFIKSIAIIDNTIVMDTVDGTIKAIKLADKIKDNYLLKRKDDYNLVGCCHAISTYMTIKYGLVAHTSFLDMGFGGKYIHSYNQDSFGYVYDASHNLILDDDTYQRLVNPSIISSISKKELVSSIEYQERLINDIEPLYSLALIKYKNNK